MKKPKYFDGLIIKPYTWSVSEESQPIVLHISGPDRPGITAGLAEILATENARLIDIGQSVLHNFLTLSAIVEVPKGSDALRKLLFMSNEGGLKLEVNTLAGLSERNDTRKRASLCISLLGELEDSHAISKTTRFLAGRKMNIREIETLSSGSLRGLELLVDLPAVTVKSEEELGSVRGEILGLAQELGVDLAVQMDDVFRHNKRLVCMDVDSTFIRMEVIDELAVLAGCEEQVKRITEDAMQGKLDFKEALRARVKCLQGLSFEKAKTLLHRVPLSPGAERFVKILKRLGFQVGLVSGGFDFFVDTLKERFDLDFAFANELEVRNGLLTGNVRGSIVDAERKAQILRDAAQLFRCRLEQVVAVGDGANDIPMLQSAGLGIAFRGKRKLQEAADLSLNVGALDSILYLMGYTEVELNSL